MGGSVSFPLPFSFIIRVGGREKYPPKEGKKGGGKVKGGGGGNTPRGYLLRGWEGGGMAPRGPRPNKKTGMQGPAFHIVGDNGMELVP